METAKPPLLDAGGAVLLPRFLGSTNDKLTIFANLRHDGVSRGSIMATMNVSLSDLMKDWVEAQAETGRYSNASDYVRDLIRRDQERQEKIAHIQGLVAQTLESGVSDKSMDEILNEARKRAPRS